VPFDRFENVRLAAPDAFNETLCRFRFPSLNVTVPAGIAVPAPGTTVAVKITGLPCVEGLTEEVTVVTVLSLFTVCVRTGEVLVLKLALPL